jgi:predicted site-specific integrase-resolvase
MADFANLLSETQAAEKLGVKPQTLAAWRCHGVYDLPFIKVGRAVRYRPEAITAWMEKNTATCVTA